MLAITEYDYFKPAAGVPAERSIHNPSFDYERNKKKCTSFTVLAGIVGRLITTTLEGGAKITPMPQQQQAGGGAN